MICVLMVSFLMTTAKRFDIGWELITVLSELGAHHENPPPLLVFYLRFKELYLCLVVVYLFFWTH